MDQPDQNSGGRPPPRRELQGPRPAPVRVRKDSYKIRKPPVAPPAPPPTQPASQSPPPPPVIIYAVSPKVIHTTPSEFMGVVQRLTGQDSASAPTSDFGGTMAASASTLAATEKTEMPMEGENYNNSSCSDMSGFMEGVEMGGGFGLSGMRPGEVLPQGMLSPGPGSLGPVSPTFFSPVSYPSPLMSFHHQHQDYDLSAIQQPRQHIGDGGGSGNNKSDIEGGSGQSNFILPSPSSSSVLSHYPTPSPNSLDFLISSFLDQ